jgi:hypothetical protein
MRCRRLPPGGEGEDTGADEEQLPDHHAQRVPAVHRAAAMPALFRDAVAPPELKVRHFADLRARRTRIPIVCRASLLIAAAALAVSLVASGGATI